MLIEMNEYDIKELLLKKYGCSEKEASTISEYIVQCCCDSWDITKWYENTEGEYFGSKEEALEKIKEEDLTIEEDCNIYVSRNGGVWFEYY